MRVLVGYMRKFWRWFVDSSVWVPLVFVVIFSSGAILCRNEDRRIERQRMTSPISTESLEEVHQLLLKEPSLKGFVGERAADYISEEEYGEIVEEYRRLLEERLR